MKRNKKQKNNSKKSGKTFENNSETNKLNNSSVERENPAFMEDEADSPVEKQEEIPANDSKNDSEGISENVSDDNPEIITEDASTKNSGIDFLEPDEYHKSKGTSKFVEPDEMLKRHLRMSDSSPAEPPEEMGTKQLKPDWFLSPDELSGEKKAPVEEKVEYSTERIEAVTPMSLQEEPKDDLADEFSLDLSEDQINTELLSKEDMLDPFDLISPDEFLPEEAHFVSRALKSGTVILGKYKIIKKIAEKRDHNSYLVKDIIEDGRKYILHEIIPPEMDQEELRKRRYKFGDNVRLLMTFKHEYLGTVYEYFTENQREYYVMEYVDGLSFTRLCKMNVKAFSEKEVRKWGADLCNVLTFLHDRPNPFTLGEFDPDDIMIDQNGNIKIITYNLHRFFDVDRTLEFMPNNPRELYDEITMLSRFLYYLLTKDEYVDDEMKAPEYPENTSAKMMKLLTLCCKTGQQSIGYIGIYEKKLEDTALPDSPDSFYDMLKHGRWGANRGISLIGKITSGFLRQNPFVIALEIILIVFLLMMGTFQKIEQKSGFTRPDGVSLLYVAGGSSILTYRQDTLKLLEDNELGAIISDLTESKISFSEYKDYKTVSTKTDALIAAIKDSSSLRILDAKNHNLLTTISVDKDPGMMCIDGENQTLLVIHKTPSTISVIDLKTLKLKRLLLTGLNPVDMTILKKIQVSDEDIRSKLREQEKKERAKQKDTPAKPTNGRLDAGKIFGMEKLENQKNAETKEKEKEETQKSFGLGEKFPGEEKTDDNDVDAESFIKEITPETVESTNTPSVNMEYMATEKQADKTESSEASTQKMLKTKKWYESENPVVAVANEGSKDIMLMDTKNGQILCRILIDGDPASVIQSVEGDKLYVLDKKAGKIIVLDIVIDRIVEEIPISLSQSVSSMALDKKRNRLWISLAKEDSIAYYDFESGKFSDTYAIMGNNPNKLYMDNKQEILWIINEHSKNIVKFDCKRDKASERIDVHKDVRAIFIEDVNSGKTTGSK